MNEKDNDSKNRFMSPGFELNRGLREAGQRLADSSVSIRELEPDLGASQTQPFGRNASNKKNAANDWPRVAAAAAIAIAVAWFLLTSGNRAIEIEKDSNSISRLNSSDGSNQVETSINPEFAEQLFAALSRKHRIALVPRGPAMIDSGSHDMFPTPAAGALKSLTKSRRFSLDKIARSVHSLESISLPRLRFRLMLDD